MPFSSQTNVAKCMTNSRAEKNAPPSPQGWVTEFQRKHDSWFRTGRKGKLKLKSWKKTMLDQTVTPTCACASFWDLQMNAGLDNICRCPCSCRVVEPRQRTSMLLFFWHQNIKNPIRIRSITRGFKKTRKVWKSALFIFWGLIHSIDLANLCPWGERLFEQITHYHYCNGICGEEKQLPLPGRGQDCRVVPQGIVRNGWGTHLTPSDMVSGLFYL